MALDLNGIWCEKYRPRTLLEISLPERVRGIIQDYQGNSEIPNLLFVGSPGTGKTTTALVIVKEILGCDYLYINASDENGIDTIRTKVSNFAQTKSFDGGIKVVILDESDFLSSNAQAALRNTMESFSKYTRFILTANYKHKIIPAIQSRCQLLDIKPHLDDSVRFVYGILKKEGITIAEDQKKKFVELVKSNFPDLRKCINEVQKNCISGELSIEKVNTSNELLTRIFDSISSKNSIELRKYLIENEEQFYGDYDTLMKDYLNFLYDKPIAENKKKEMIAIIAEHLYRAAFVVDHEINCFACWITLESIS